MIVFKDIITCKHVTIFSQSSKDGNDAKNQKETRRRNTITIYLCQKYNISKVLIFLREKKKKKNQRLNVLSKESLASRYIIVLEF